MAAPDSPKINMPGNVPYRGAMAPRADFVAKQQKRTSKEIPPAAPVQTSTPQPPISLNPPATGFEHWWAKQEAGFGGTRMAGRGSNYRERVNKGQFKGMTPAEAKVKGLEIYSKMPDAQRDTETAEAKGDHIRTPAEKAAFEQYDQGMSRLMFGDQAGGATGASPQPAERSPESQGTPSAAPQTKPGAAERFRTAARTQMAGMTPQERAAKAQRGEPLVSTAGERTRMGTATAGDYKGAEATAIYRGGQLVGTGIQAAPLPKVNTATLANTLPADAKGYDGKPLKADGTAQTPAPKINAPMMAANTDPKRTARKS